MKKIKNGSVLGVAVLAGLSTMLLAGSAAALEPQLEKSVQMGKDNFTHNTFGGSGKVCQSCHLDGGMKPGQLPDGKPIPSLTNAAAIFPRYSNRVNKIVTLPDQIRLCIAGGLKGTPPEYGSEELNSLASYVTSLSQGKQIDMGGKPQ